MFDRPKTGERTLLVHAAPVRFDDIPRRAEFEELAESSGAQTACSFIATVRQPEPKYLIGKGRAEFLKDIVANAKIELVIVSEPLTPSQERNLEQLLCCRVLDRTGLILDIFAQRARSFEGKLQVELAQLRHLTTRLIRGWTHLERQKGGIGLRGPGETQLETDRRLLAQRIKVLSSKLGRIVNQREQRRARRRRADVPTVSLVGYTNAGKSTLFNALTGADVYQAQQQFATLDPTLRKLELPQGEPVVIADTVGFIRDLPPDLIAAFRATLEETRDATLLIHVVDASEPQHTEQIEHVNAVLAQLDAQAIPQILVYNKIDCLPETTPAVARDADGQVQRVWLSAQRNLGLDLLREAIAEQLLQDQLNGWLHLPAAAGRLRARCYALGISQAEHYTDDGALWLQVSLSQAQLNSLQSEFEVALTLHAAPLVVAAQEPAP